MANSVQHDGRRERTTIIVLACFFVLACVSRWDGDVPLQSWWAERGPVVPHDTFPADCSLCHEADGWTDIHDDFAFDHLAETGVELIGEHKNASCLRCHNDRGPVALFASRGCAGCHEDIHRSTMGGDCGACHDESGWRPKNEIAVHARTRFPLVGAHAAAACWRCHPGSQTGEFARTSTSCESCHADDLALALDPDHVGLGWVVDCERCHFPTTWQGQGFTHATWPLTGAHAVTDCSQCHIGGVFAGTPRNCVDCHLDEYLITTDPDHQTFGFPTQCDLCHDTVSWEGAEFNHLGIVTGCVDCHLPDYIATTDPDHQAVGFPTNCEVCHFSTTTWDDAVFDHTFKITSGPHGPLDCSDCHTTPRMFLTASCTHCHEHSLREASDEHSDVRGFVWSSPACISCHPTGEE